METWRSRKTMHLTCRPPCAERKDTTMAQNGIRPPSFLAMVRSLLPSILVNGVLVFVLYLLVKDFTSASDIMALVISAIPAMIFTVAGIIRQRQVDIFGAFALITIAVSILLTFVTGDPKL